MTGQNCVDIHLFQFDASVGNRPLRNDFEIADLIRGFLSAVRLHESNHDVEALLALEVGIAQHVVSLAHTRCGANIDAQFRRFLLGFELKFGHRLTHLDRMRSVGRHSNRQREPKSGAVTQAALHSDLAAE